MTEVKRYCTLLAKDSINLSRGEFLACLEAERLGYRVLRTSGCTLCLEVSGDVERAASRSARLKLLIEEVTEESLPRGPEALPLALLLEQIERVKPRTFGVRFVNVGTELDKQEWERVVGGRIKNFAPWLRVDLEKPDVWVVVLADEERIHLGLLKYRPGARFSKLSSMPFLTSAAMESRLARTMINLARVARGEVILDPFCGIGGILLEAAKIGVHVVGGDISRKVVRGSVDNFKWAGLSAVGFAVADVLHSPFVRADGIACDPPYGRNAPLFGRSLKEIYEATYSLATSILSRERYLVTIIPHYAFDELLPEGEELKLVEKYEVTVHGTLTRVVTVFRRA